MRLGITTDMNLVKGILADDDIWSRMAEDGADKDSFIPTFNELKTWLIIEDADVMGVMLITRENVSTINIHPYLLKRYHHMGREMMKDFYKWFLKYVKPDVVKITAMIPETDKKLRNFASKVGFKNEGVNRESYARQGNIFDQYYIGITRREIELWVA